ncbi:MULTISPECIES: DUF6809 family protein [Anaerotruncus]|nr:DUF6809 family protein [Anaerotruncus massiliensis (ex Togo et al. 2019)]
MPDILEELYLERLSFIEERCRDTPEYNAASDEYDAARAALRQTLNKRQRRLLLRVEDAQAALCDCTAAAAFAGGWRLRARLAASAGL